MYKVTSCKELEVRVINCIVLYGQFICKYNCQLDKKLASHVQVPTRGSF